MRNRHIEEDNILLHEIIDNSVDSIFVTDKNGVIILANPAASLHLNLPVDELIGSNVEDLIEQGYYNYSTALEATRLKQAVTGIVETLNGMNLIATSTPLFDENGEIKMVVTNSRNKDVLEEVLQELEKEKAKARKYENEVKYLRHRNSGKVIVAESSQMKEVLKKANAVAKTDSTVMLYGESGTGKDVIAHYIHARSLRNKAPFITLNCATIPEALLESELFGYEHGAFTGAKSKGKPGLFEIADGGTIFLDEIAEMPLALQAKLLRVLENSEIRRVGGTELKQIDVRVISATNKDLKSMIDKKLFREDLYYRLNVIPITIAPLRDRQDDIEALANMFLKEFNTKYRVNKYFNINTINAFKNYNWPGNVRELRNVVERLIITSTSDEISLPEAKTSIPYLNENFDIKSKYDNIEVNSYEGTLKEVLAEVEEKYINQVLAECDNRIGEAAKRLGIHRSGLYRKLKKFNEK